MAGSTGLSSGGSQTDMWSSLGSGIRSDSLDSMERVQNMIMAMKEQQRQAGLDIENKRQFNVMAGMQGRDRDLQGIGMLADLRNQALQNSRLNTFKRMLTQG